MRLFDTQGDYLAYEKVLQEAHEHVAMRTVAYCIMPNHWHLVLWPRNDGDLSEFMQWLTLTHTQRWHAAHGTAGIGHVYQGRFKSFPVQSNEYYLTVLRYIESNPLRAGLVDDSRDWQYSSLAIRNGIEKEQGPAINRGPVKLPDGWNRLVNVLPNESIDARLQNCIKRGCPFGNDKWIRMASQKLGLEITLRPRGRPKKGS